VTIGRPDTTRNRRVEQGQETRRQLLDVARALFLERGYDATSIELVLDRASISRGALYHHFQSKQELFEAVLEDVEGRLAKGTLAATIGVTDPVAMVKAGCRAFLRMARDPDIKRIVLTDAPAVVGWERWREIDERHAFGILKLGIAGTPAGTQMPIAAQETLAHVLLASLLELGMLIARSDKPRATQKTAEEVLDKLLDRLLAE
jgi:AcrR family transcriptional regulator